MNPFNRNRERQQEKAFYERTQKNANMGRRDLKQPIKKNVKTQASSPWWYKGPAIAITAGIVILVPLVIQYFLMVWVNIGVEEFMRNGFWHNYGAAPFYVLWFLIGTPAIGAYAMHRCRAVWANNNAMFLSDDIEEYANDAYVRTPEHIIREFDAAPDAGLGFDGHVSSIVGHMMISNKGIKKIDMPVFDPDREGQVAVDENGKVITKKVDMFDKDFAMELYRFSNVPMADQKWFNATDYAFNERNSTKEAKHGNARKGPFGRKNYDTLADYINGEFYALETDTQRPAGVYFYDSRPVNTILIAITRGGKGQTYIEPIIDLWTREKNKWNIFSTDPKGELLAKFYYPATVRGMDVIQFNLMHPHLTNVFNPLINAVQQFRRNDPTKGTAIIDSIIEMLFPDNGEIWNPAAGNMFRRAVYMVMDYYIEQEKYLRYVGHRDNVPQEVIDAEIDNIYGKVTLFNIYKLIGELAAKVSKDEQFINVNPEDPPVTEKDLLTLMFDAMAMLPTNDLRSKAITANNAIKQVASAPQTIAGIYATLLTGLSVYADDTAIALMSGGLTDSFDITGLGFPRRIGIKFDDAFIKKFRITEELCTWTIYRDSYFKDQYEGNKFTHREKLPPSGWTWGHFEGIFDQEVVYIRLTISSGRTVVKTFNFRFTKGYKTFDNISYVIDPITKKKIIAGGTLEEWDIEKQCVTVSAFLTNVFDYMGQTYRMKDMPVIAANQVYYTERPKCIFAVTPPHLQVYQRHILVMIKQILDEIYSMSYSTKTNRKPIVGTRLMLEEFGNIRSGDQGIPNIDTATSIALGQNVQITFVLQSFQQLRAIYSEEVEKVIRSNCANTVFLKSNDEELINELVRMSGTMHEFRVKSKSVSRKLADVVTTAEPVVNMSGEHNETTALTANDFLFLAGQSPGNSITIISGEMPIVNKLATIVPMAAGLHKKLPQQTYNKRKGQTEPYSDSSMPSSKSSDNINYLDNVIDGEKMVRARVEQAKIARKMKDVFLKVSKEHGISVSEDNGELADLMMNYVYEEYDKQSGTSRKNLATPVEYWQVAEEMSKGILTIRDPKQDSKTKMAAATVIREHLVKCILDENLNKLTSIYRDKKAKNILGYDPIAISTFVGQLLIEYPKPKPLETEERDIDAMAEQDPNYRKQDPYAEPDFDAYDAHAIDALEQALLEMVEGSIQPPRGVAFRRTKTDDGEEWELTIENLFIASYRAMEDTYTVTFNDDRSLISRMVSKVPEFVELLQNIMMDNDY